MVKTSFLNNKLSQDFAEYVPYNSSCFDLVRFHITLCIIYPCYFLIKSFKVVMLVLSVIFFC